MSKKIAAFLLLLLIFLSACVEEPAGEATRILNPPKQQTNLVNQESTIENTPSKNLINLNQGFLSESSWKGQKSKTEEYIREIWEKNLVELKEQFPLEYDIDERQKEISESFQKTFTVKTRQEKEKILGFGGVAAEHELLDESVKLTIDSVSNQPKKILFKKGHQLAERGLENLATQAKNFLRENQSILKVDPDNLQEQKTIKVKKLEKISFTQTHQGIPVFHSEVEFLKSNNKFVSAKLNYYSDIGIDINPLISEAQAIKKAQQYSGIYINPTTVVLGIYPKRFPDKIEYFLTYKIDLPPKTIFGKPFNPTIYIDAKTNEIVEVFNHVWEENSASGYISGDIYPQHPFEPSIRKNFANQTIYSEDKAFSTETNSEGYFSFEIGENSLVETALEGPFIKVVNKAQDVSSAQLSLPLDDAQIDWANYDNSYKGEESNLFYHANLIHNFFTQGPEPFTVEELDFQMEAVVQHNDTCNAFANGVSINFFTAGGGCESLSLMSDVIYHEYTHNLTFALAPLLSEVYSGHTGNMNEGFPDYFACTINNETCMGEYFRLTPDCLRSCENEKRFPQDYSSEAHYAAEIISGAMWDIRQEVGQEIADTLALLAIDSDPQTFTELLENYIEIDDSVYGNGIPEDGSPHIHIICDSFLSNHGVFSEECLGNTTKPIVTMDNPTTFSDFFDFIGTVYPSKDSDGTDFSYTLSVKITEVLITPETFTAADISKPQQKEILSEQILLTSTEPIVDSLIFSVDSVSLLNDYVLGKLELISGKKNHILLDISLIVTEGENQNQVEINNIFPKNLEIKFSPDYTYVFNKSDTIEIIASVEFENANHFDAFFVKIGEEGIQRTEGITLDNGGSFTGSEKIGSWMVPEEEGDYALYVKAFRDDGKSAIQSANVYVDTTLKQGWPKAIPVEENNHGERYSFALNPIAKDLDKDGSKEIILFDSGNPPKLFSYNFDGSLNWSGDIGEYQEFENTFNNYKIVTEQNPIITNLDSDNADEILVFNVEEDSNKLAVFLFEHDGTLKWRKEFDFFETINCFKDCDVEEPVVEKSVIEYVAFNVFDLENDSNPEIIFNVIVSSEFSPDGFYTYGRETEKVLVLGNQGNLLNSWDTGRSLAITGVEIPFSYLINNSNYSNLVNSHPVIGNFDSDSDFEILVSTEDLDLTDTEVIQFHELAETYGEFADFILENNNHNLEVFNKDGSLVWSKTIPDTRGASYVTGDIDNDSKDEIVLESLNYLGLFDSIVYHSEHKTLHILDDDGESIAQLLKGGILTSNPILADFENDGYLEIVASFMDLNFENPEAYDPYFGFNLGKIFAIDHTGSIIWSKSHDENMWFQGFFPMYSMFSYRKPPIVLSVIDQEKPNIISEGWRPGIIPFLILSPFNNLNFFDTYGGRLSKLSPVFPSITSKKGATQIKDIDFDNFYEIVLSPNNQMVYVWETDYPLNSGNNQWPDYLHDSKHSGCYNCDLCPNEHENNGDGTCTAFIRYPVEDGSVYIDGEWVKNQEREQLFMGKSVATDWRVNRSYVEWNTSEIPNTAIIEEVTLLYEGSYQISSEIWDIYSKPSTSSPEEIFYDSGEGTAYITFGSFPEHGTSEISLPRTTIEHLQNQLTQNWFAIGMKSTDENAGSGSWIESKENTDANPKPTLKVTYKPKPVCGDGLIEGTEQCDDGDTQSCDGCNANCSREDDVCGDGIIECGEVCERGNSKACRIGSIVGTKKCNSTCTNWGSCQTKPTCFLENTEIKTPTSNKKIQDLKIGDTVMSYNEQTGLMEPTKVVETFAHTTDSYLIINGKLKVTSNHPMLVNGEWMEIGNAKIGDKIRTVNGWELVKTIEVVNEKVEVYNIEVEKNHNYYAEDYLAHNKVGGREI